MSEHKQLEFDFELDEISDHFIVSESNALIEAKTNLTLYEERIIYILASRIHPEDTKFKTHFFKVRDIAEKLDIVEKNFYKRVREVIDGLQEKRVIINEKNQNSTLSANWVAAARYYHGRGLIELEFSELLKPYLLQLKENFTKFKLSNVLYLKSAYSSKLYKLLKQYLPLGKRRFTLENLRDKLELEPGTYKKYSHIKNRIILSAQAELEAKTDIKYTFEEIKSGARVVGIIFHIFSNPKHTIEGLNDKEFIAHEDTTELLARFEVSKKVAKEMIEKYGEKRIRDNIEYVYTKKRNMEVSNMAGYIIRAVEDNYANSSSVYETEDEDDRETSIYQLNDRISSILLFHERCVLENLMTEKESKQNSLRGIMNEILLIGERRIHKNLRPLTEDDLKNHQAKKIFRMLSQEKRLQAQ
ncbi:replication initiation protein [Paenibacillus enshidis]|uniref:Replication initiation protein n=1 Tax=Paenibacillus enshidis TaxID=1458439 RepID=A0ABV5AVD5_9BACL